MIVNGGELEFAALPPDVRKVSDLPNEYLFFLGLCPHVPRTRGQSPEDIRPNCRKVGDLPHIRRQSR